MQYEFRNRIFAAFVIVAVIPAGLISRHFRSSAASHTPTGFLTTYSGDTLWPIMFYFFGRFLLPKSSYRTLFIATIALTLGIEFGQLWKPPVLQWLREQPISGFLLGNTFLWSDVACCVLGAIIAVLIDLTFAAMLRRKSLGSHPKLP